MKIFDLFIYKHKEQGFPTAGRHMDDVAPEFQTYLIHNGENKSITIKFYRKVLIFKRRLSFDFFFFIIFINPVKFWKYTKVCDMCPMLLWHIDNRHLWSGGRQKDEEVKGKKESLTSRRQEVDCV